MLPTIAELVRTTFTLGTTAPDGSRVRPGYDEAGLLARVDVALAGTGDWQPYVTGIAFGTGADAVLISSGAATYDLFPLLGTHAQLGRFFDAAEDSPDAPEHVAQHEEAPPFADDVEGARHRALHRAEALPLHGGIVRKSVALCNPHSAR